MDLLKTETIETCLDVAIVYLDNMEFSLKQTNKSTLIYALLCGIYYVCDRCEKKFLRYQTSIKC